MPSFLPFDEDICIRDEWVREWNSNQRSDKREWKREHQ
jgi:hypothetical protein